MVSSSSPSSAREVLVGSALGIGRLRKWITCALIGALPVVAGGRFLIGLTSFFVRPWAKR
jgi:hypothetical protein